MTSTVLDYPIPYLERSSPPLSENIDAAINTARAKKDVWVATGIPERIEILGKLIQGVAAAAG